MIKRLYFFFLGILLSVSLSGIWPGSHLVQAQTTRAITWDALIPQAQMEFDDPFAALTEDQLYELSMVARYRELRQRGKLGPGDESAEAQAEFMASLKAQGIDVDWLLSQRERVAEARGQQVDRGTSVSGQHISIPGYALPLTLNGGSLTEFLLVPWVGACIHTPPPPANQIIHVTFPQGTAPRNRFSPVQIEGHLEHNPADYMLYLIDGSRPIRATYTLTAEAIAYYEPTGIDALSQVTIPEGAMTGQHGWQRLQSQISLMFTNTMADIQGQPFSKAMGVGLLVAFLYGILHTLGPGHGKAVIVSYFVGEGGSLRRGLWMGIRIAVLHVLAAMVLVVLTDVVVRQAGGSAAGNFRIMRLISYGSIAAIGAWMLWRALQPIRHLSGDHPSIDYALPADQGMTAADAILYGNLTQQVLDRKKVTKISHRMGWNCRCFDYLDDSSVGGWLSVAIGAVPCSGALIVMLYGLANDLLGASIAMVVAISLGMAVALSAIGILAIWGRQTLNRKIEKTGQGQKIATIFQIGGAAIVFLLGSGLFVFTAMSSA